MGVESSEQAYVTVSHQINRHTALATYHLRIHSEAMIFLDCEREVVRRTEERESAFVSGRTYEAVGRFEPKNRI
jgi:hypothetical protein